MLSIQYLSFYSALDFFYDEAKHQQGVEYIPLMFRQIYNFGTYKQCKNNPRYKIRKIRTLRLGEKSGILKTECATEIDQMYHRNRPNVS